MKKDFDIIVIGAGSGGLTASIGLAKAGKSVLLIEKDKIGGDCTNSGCVPSKALIHQSEYAKSIKTNTYLLKDVIKNALPKVRDTIQSFLKEESPENIEALGVKVIFGDAQFVDKYHVKVGNESYCAKYIIISTGSSPRTLDIPGIEYANAHTSDSIFNLDNIPGRLLVIGSGPIGMELGQAFARLGSNVTIASIDNALGRLEEPEVAKELEDQFNKDGITFIGNAYIKEFTKDGEAIFEIKKEDKIINTIKIPNDAVLISIGRIANTQINLEKAGVKYTKYGITTNRKYRTNINHIFAIGDVTDRLKFTHVADDAARNVIKQILIPLPIFTKIRVVPKVTYTDPELAQVGLSYKQAIKDYGENSIIKIVVPFAKIVDRSRIDGTGGVLVIIAKRLSGRILGGHIAHARGGDMLAFLTLAIKSRQSMWKLNNMIFPYPSYSQVFKKASDQFLTETIKTIKVDILNLFKKHFTKISALIFWGILLYIFNSYKVAHGLDTKELSIMLASFITSTLWGPLIYMLFYIFRPLILFPAVLLTTLSGVMFGFWGGFIFTMIGENLSASFVYLIGRFFGKNIQFKDTFIGPMVTKICNETFISVLLARFLFFPFDLTNLACGAMKARWRSYALATFIGIIPGMSTFIALGASFENVSDFDLSMLHINSTTLLVSITLFVFTLTLAKALRKYHK